MKRGVARVMYARGSSREARALGGSHMYGTLDSGAGATRLLAKASAQHRECVIEVDFRSDCDLTLKRSSVMQYASLHHVSPLRVLTSPAA